MHGTMPVNLQLARLLCDQLCDLACKMHSYMYNHLIDLCMDLLDLVDPCYYRSLTVCIHTELDTDTTIPLPYSRSDLADLELVDLLEIVLSVVATDILPVAQDAAIQQLLLDAFSNILDDLAYG